MLSKLYAVKNALGNSCINKFSFAKSFDTRIANTKIITSFNASIISEKYKPNPKVEKVLNWLQVTGVAQPKLINVDLAILENNIKPLTKPLHIVPLPLHFLTCYPSIFSLLLSAYLSISHPLDDFFCIFPITYVVMFCLKGLGSLDNFYPGWAILGYRRRYLKSDGSYLGILEANKLHHIYEALFKKYKGNIVCENFTPASKQLINDNVLNLLTLVSKSNYGESLHNFVTLNKDYFKLHLHYYVTHFCEELENLERSVSPDDVKRKHMTSAMKAAMSLYPEELHKDYVVKTINDELYTLQSYSDHYDLKLFK